MFRKYGVWEIFFLFFSYSVKNLVFENRASFHRNAYSQLCIDEHEVCSMELVLVNTSQNKVLWSKNLVTAGDVSWNIDGVKMG